MIAKNPGRLVFQRHPGVLFASDQLLTQFSGLIISIYVNDQDAPYRSLFICSPAVPSDTAGRNPPEYRLTRVPFTGMPEGTMFCGRRETRL